MNATDDWSAAVHVALRQAGVRQVSYVPDAGLRHLIALAEGDPDLRTLALTSEEEGIGIAAGAWLGGQRAVVLMQSSGIGNCVNALASLAQACAFPMLLLVTMRGEWGETNPWQVPMGRASASVLTAVGVAVQRADHAAEVGATVAAAAQLTFSGGPPAAVLIGQRVVGAKVFAE